MKNPMTVSINGEHFFKVKSITIKRKKKTGEMEVLMTFKKGKTINRVYKSAVPVYTRTTPKVDHNDSIEISTPNREVDITGEGVKA